MAGVRLDIYPRPFDVSSWNILDCPDPKIHGRVVKAGLHNRSLVFELLKLVSPSPNEASSHFRFGWSLDVVIFHDHETFASCRLLTKKRESRRPRLLACGCVRRELVEGRFEDEDLGYYGGSSLFVFQWMCWDMRSHI